MKKVAIVQSNYVPWRGYFDLINSVDEFVIYDDVQYTRRDWRNRNQIKTPQGPMWLSVPVQAKGKYLQPINDTRIDGEAWAQAHWRTIELNYSRATSFEEVKSWLKPCYLQVKYELLSDLNRSMIENVNLRLNIATRIRDSREFSLKGNKSERLLNICLESGATHYLSGPAAREYLDTELFLRHGVEVQWMSYPNYKAHLQLWGGFVENLSILDFLLNSPATDYPLVFEKE
jgi:hypothetical protein